jgi:hypothetical protein
MPIGWIMAHPDINPATPATAIAAINFLITIPLSIGKCPHRTRDNCKT